MDIELDGLTDEERARLAVEDKTVGGAILFRVLRERLEEARQWRRRCPKETPENWKTDIRWLLSEEETLETILELPKAAREAQAKETTA